MFGMDLPTLNSASAGTRAITIPLHAGNTVPPHHVSNQGSRQRNHQSRRPSKPERADSDAGNASSSSLGSDWAVSPTSHHLSGERSRFGLQAPVASPPTAIEQGTPPGRGRRKDKQRAVGDVPPNNLPLLFQPSQSPLGPSMLSSSAYKSINLNSHHDPDSNEPARLITYTKYSQGFTWNDELFLPSYLLGRHRYRRSGGSGIRRRLGTGDDNDDNDDDIGEFEEEGERCPVTDIFVTDEEAAAMMP